MNCDIAGGAFYITKRREIDEEGLNIADPWSSCPRSSRMRRRLGVNQLSIDVRQGLPFA